ncbi:MAG TPA: response regulator [Longimicrobium sp.]|uniref:response regulator transcription factor n=1 Tax=Longimicrobium sp. TaxID=2029185 RepID=UPI002ED8A6A8
MHRILIVEDTPEIFHALQRHLERRGYQTFLATRAAQALPLAASQKPDLVILDLGLPDRDGYSVLEQLRERGDETPVLILSARTEEADKVRGFRLGADDYVTKPFGAAELLERIGVLLRRAARASAPVPPPAQTAAELTDEQLCERYGLTPQQVVVARLMGDGLSNAEIARRLFVSVNTARNHASGVRTKLGVSRRGRISAILRGAAPA